MHYNVKKYLFLTLALLLFLFTPIFKIQAQSDEHIVNYDVAIKIKESGQIHVVETIKYTFPQPKHGFYREIKHNKKSVFGALYHMDIRNLSVNVDGEASAFFDTEKRFGSYFIKVGDPDRTVTGTHIYTISYDVSGALTYFDDHDELYWNAVGTDFGIPVRQASATITFDPKIDHVDLKVACFTGNEDSTHSDCTYAAGSDEVITIRTDKPLQPGEGLTIAVGFPPGLVNVLEPRLSLISAIVIGSLIILSIAWYLVLPAIVLIRYLRERKSVRSKLRIVAAWFTPPKDAEGKEYTPAQTGYLVEKSIDNRFISATLLHLAKRGVIKIRVEKGNKITFIKTNDFLDLTDYEKDLLEGIFTGDNLSESKLDDLKNNPVFASYVTRFKDNVSKSVKKDNLFRWDPLKFASAIILLAVLSLFLGFNILLFLLLVIFVRRAVPMTDLGIEKYSEAVSLKNFLISQDEKLDFQAENQMFFEKLLPYASAFGVEDVWIKRFGNLDVKLPDWYEGEMSGFSGIKAINTAVAQTMKSSSVYSSGTSHQGFSSGFSGGRSGGGGGGGGGGSW